LSEVLTNPYHYVAPEVSYCQDTGTNSDGFGQDNFLGNKIGAGADVIGKSVTKVQYNLACYSGCTGTGTVSAVVYQGAPSSPTLVHTFVAVSISSLNLIPSKVIKVLSGSAYTIQEDDSVGIQVHYTGGVYPSISCYENASLTDSHWVMIEYNGTNWYENTGRSMRMCIIE